MTFRSLHLLVLMWKVFHSTHSGRCRSVCHHAHLGQVRLLDVRTPIVKYTSFFLRGTFGDEHLSLRGIIWRPVGTQFDHSCSRKFVHVPLPFLFKPFLFTIETLLLSFFDCAIILRPFYIFSWAVIDSFSARAKC